METQEKIMLGAGLALLGTTAIIAYIKRDSIERVVNETVTAVKQEAIEQYNNLTDDMGKKKSYFTIEELCASSTAKQKGIDNTPNDYVRNNLQLLINNVLNPARERLGKAITVSSGYRCPALNSAVGGVSTSQHLTGMAADLVAGKGAAEDMKRLFEILVGLGNFDQLIWEHPKNSVWIHVSYNPNGGRAQILDYHAGKYTNINNNWQTYFA
jgi:uncharacterized protein YcbK (DUF882 family)